MTGVATSAPARRHDLDWLRIGATFLLFPFHVAKVFDVLPMYHVKHPAPVAALDHLTSFVHWWHMPLFFVLAGWSTYASLARRGPAAFVRERARRLLVPFVTGIVLLCPVIKYCELRSGLSMTADGVAVLAEPFRESFLAFLPTFFTRLDRFTWSHLWFLIYLFTFSAVYAPLLARLARRPPRLAHVTTLRLYAPLVPLILVQITLRLRWPGVQNLYDDWANVAYYSMFFLWGFAIARTPVWEGAIAREWRRAGVIGLAATAAMTAGWLGLGRVGMGALADTAPGFRLGMHALTAVIGYCLIVALWGFARRHLAGTNPWREYLAEASLPIYVLHQVVIVVLAYAVVRTSLGIPAQFALLLTGSVALTLVAYHVGVWRSPLLSVALGGR